MTQTVQQPAAVSVEELRQAWTALRDGRFRTPRTGIPTPAWPAHPEPASAWVPGLVEQVVTVIGCGGSTGATTTALAVATVAGRLPQGRGVRVVECATATATGLAAASTAELGPAGEGWVRGTRDGLVLDRVADTLSTPGQVPHPPPLTDPPAGLSVVDVGWELGQVLTGSGWLHDLAGAGGPVLLTATATVPGLRRLEAALGLLAGMPVCGAVLGPPLRRWPGPVAHTAGPAVRALRTAGRLVAVPADRALARDGVTGATLPGPVLSAARLITSCLFPADLLEGPSPC